MVTHEGRVHRARALLVAPNVGRRIRAADVGFFSLSLDPTHPASRHLREQVLAGRDSVDLSHAVTADALALVQQCVERTRSCADMRQVSDRLLDHFFPDARAAPLPDARVLAAAAGLRRQVPTRAQMEPLCREAGLSRGRLTHLFTQELGTSIRSYLRWVKLCKAAELFGREHSATEVATRIGFADSAHLSRVFRGYFSVAPSFIANRALVRVHACPA